MADQCSHEIIGLSVTAAGFAIAFVGSTLWNYCRKPPTKSQGCPYCDAPFPPAAIREHLLSCPEHLKHWTANGSRRGMTEVFYVKHPAKS